MKEALAISLLTVLNIPKGNIKAPSRPQTQVKSLGEGDPLEKGMATHSSILAWEIPWAEKPGGLQSMGSERVGHH